MASADREPITGIWGGAPSGCPGAEAPEACPGAEAPEAGSFLALQKCK